MEQRQLRNEPVAVALLVNRAKIIFVGTEFSSLTEVKQLLTEAPSLKSWQRTRNDDSFPNNPRLEIQSWIPVANAFKRAYNFMPAFMKGLQSTHLPVVDLLRCPLEDQALGKNTSDSCSSHEATQPPLWKDPLACMTFLGHNNTGFLYGMQQNKAWQVISISYFALVHFAIKTSRSYTCYQEGS